MNLKKLTNKYFADFEKKNIFNLNNSFQKNILLIDSGRAIKGNKKVLNFNKQIFKKNKIIKIKILSQAFDISKNISFSYIKVILDKKSYNIVDLIEFSKKSKIKKIIAFINLK